MTYRLLFGPCLLVLLCAGCISNPFAGLTPDYSELPADQLAALASEIEANVAQGNRAYVPEPRAGIVIAPEVTQAIRTRAARGELLREFQQTGFAYETKNGLASIVRSNAYKQSTTRKDRSRNAFLIQNENENRWAIYEGLIEASGWPKRSLDAVQETFRQARVAQLPPGVKYETPAGEMQVK